MSSTTEYLDKAIAGVTGGIVTPPDCWIVYKTLPPRDEIVGAPLAIYAKKESLYKCFESLCNRTSSRYGITLAAYWFDDPKCF
jgi:hypothetical protein